MVQQNGGLLGPGTASLGAGIGALMQTLGNLNQGQNTSQPSVFNRLGGGTPQGKPSSTNNQGGSPQKVDASGGGGEAESPAAKIDESPGVKTPQNQPWQQRNQGGGRWGQQNPGGRNQQGGGGGNWQQRNNQNQASPAGGGGRQNPISPAGGGGGGRQNPISPAGGGGGQQGSWQGGQNRGNSGQWGQNRDGNASNSSQQQNEPDNSRRGGPPGGRQGGRGGMNESPQNRNYGGNRGGEGGGGFGGRRSFGGRYDKIRDAVMQLSGPQIELEPMEFTEKKFNANSRLFVGNLPRELEEEELKEMFTKYGEIGDLYYNKQGSYAFINFDFRCNAEKAKKELQSHVLKGRTMKVRVASVSTGIRVKNLSPQVSNELLLKAFSVFGEVDSCRVMVNERGKPTGEGMVIYADKKGWSVALRKCEEECYFLTSDTRPCVVEPMEAKEEEDGQPEISMPKNQAYHHERQQGPRFADPNSFEFEYGQRYKRLYEILKEKRAALDRDFAIELDQLEAKMAIAKHDYETEQLRRELERREADMDRLLQRANYAGVGDQYGGGYGGGGSHQGGGGAGYGGARPQQSGGYGGPGSQGGSGFDGNDSQQFRSPHGPPAQGGYRGSPAMQGEDFQRGVKRPAEEEPRPDTTAAVGAGTEGTNEFDRRKQF